MSHCKRARETRSVMSSAFTDSTIGHRARAASPGRRRRNALNIKCHVGSVGGAREQDKTATCNRGGAIKGVGEAGETGPGECSGHDVANPFSAVA
jgi:hypothetical protein